MNQSVEFATALYARSKTGAGMSSIRTAESGLPGAAPSGARLTSRTPPGAARAADPRYPDWPCNQLKVPEISIAAVWAGPPIDEVRETWHNDPQIRDLVDRLAARRTPMQEAEKSIAQFIVGDGAAKEDRAKRLFAGLFGLPENVTPVSSADAAKLLAGLLGGPAGAVGPQSDAAEADDDTWGRRATARK